MNKTRGLLVSVLGAIGLGVLILDAKTALAGANEGIELCRNVLIPTLLPFFFLSNLLTTGLMGRKISLFRPIGKLCKLPEGAEAIFFGGILGGYPLGAQWINQACQNGSLSPSDARRMLAFCNNCGPAFLFGISAVLFRSPITSWLLYIIHMISAVSVAIILPGKPGTCLPVKTESPNATTALWKTLRAVASVCGWVMLFRILLTFIQRWSLGLINDQGIIIISGILELSNGCTQLMKIESQRLRMLLCSAFFSFGGLCVTMQTYSATPDVDQSLYFPGKILQAMISLFLVSLLCMPRLAVIPALLAGILGFFLRKKENRCRNSEKLVV